LALHGIASTLREPDDHQLYVDVTTHDLLILHRVTYSDLIGDLIEIAHLRGQPVIFETDDLIFAPELYASIAFIDTLSPDAAERFRTSLHAQAQTFALSDYVLTTTHYLAQAATARSKPALIHRNACSSEMLRTAEAAYALRQARPERTEVVLGYFSGTGSHNRDFATITPALLTVLERHPQVWLHVSGHLELDRRFNAYRERIRRAPFVAWQELPQLVAQVDINLAPLELDNPFCQAKSEIKYTEAALVGIPTVASPTDAFRYAIRPGETGLLAATPDEWLAALTTLIEQPAERQRLGEAAHRQVYADYSPQTRSADLLNTLHEITTSYLPTAADAERLPTLLATAMSRQLERLVQEKQQQAKQLEQLRTTLAGWQPPPDEAGRTFWRQSYEQAEAHHHAALQTILARLQKRAEGPR
jgi:glycosyltransferase involved in cell wall biosynthesis